MATGDETSVGNDTIELGIPLRAEFAAHARVVVASIGADAGFSVDEIDDLRLAVSEVLITLTESGGDQTDPGRALAVFTVHPGSVEVVIRRDPDDSVPAELDALSGSILSSVVDEYQVDGGAIRLVKRASESASPTR